MYPNGFGADEWQSVAARSATPVTSAFAKVPVPVAAPAPVVDAPYPYPTEETGMPTWIWIAGGLAVVGAGVAYFATRK